MILITYDLATGTAKLSQSTTIKVGADVPVQVTFSRAPGDVDGLQLILGTDAAPSANLAYTEAFEQENDTTWTALLDATDTRLATYMNGKQIASVFAELIAFIDGARRVLPNMPVTVQAKILSGPGTSEGGPNYLTEGQSDDRYQPKSSVLSTLASMPVVNLTANSTLTVAHHSATVTNYGATDTVTHTLSAPAGTEIEFVNEAEGSLGMVISPGTTPFLIGGTPTVMAIQTFSLGAHCRLKRTGHYWHVMSNSGFITP